MKRLLLVASLLSYAAPAEVRTGSASVIEDKPSSTSMVFPSAEVLSTRTKLYGKWRSPCYFRMTPPTDAKRVSYSPIDTFSAGASPKIHFVVANCGKRPDRVTGLKVDVLDSRGSRLSTETFPFSDLLNANALNTYCVPFAKGAELAPGNYRLRVTLNPERASAVGQDSRVTSWSFSVSEGKPKGKAGKKKTDFVLFDRKKTSMPVMHCEVPSGWVGCGWVHWAEGSLPPVRYVASAYDTRSDDCMSLGSAVVLQPKGQYGRLNQVRELTDPSQVAQRFLKEASLQFVLKNVRLASATYEPDSGKEGKALQENRLKAARAHGFSCTAIRFGKIRMRFLGERNGVVYAVNYVMPYLLQELNGMFSVGELLAIDSCCTPADPAREQALLGKLDAFIDSRLICKAFEKLVEQKVDESRVEIMRTQEEILQIFQEVNAYKEEVYHGTTYSWEGVIQNTSVRKSENGLRYRVDGNFDNYRIDESTNEYLCWNDGDVNPGYNPNYDERYGDHQWKDTVKEN